MTTYVRPPIDAPVFRDDDGRVIDYGRRWGDSSPPDDTYSVDPYPERFTPLHTVAEALIAHLRNTYDVSVREGDETAADLMHPRSDVVRSVRVSPNDPDCASLTFVFTSYPGLGLHAGLLHDFYYPPCGCDACDANWDTEADELERQVLAVATGGYREAVEGRVHPWVECSFAYPDGGTSGRSRVNRNTMPPERLEVARQILRQRLDGWAAWPTTD